MASAMPMDIEAEWASAASGTPEQAAKQLIVDATCDHRG